MSIIEAFLSLFKKKSTQTIVTTQENLKMLTYDQLLAINENKNPDMCKYYLDALNKVLPEYKIDTKLRLSHFLAQIIHESGNLKYKSENLNYSAKVLLSTFGKYFKNEEVANQYARKPEKIANKVYANRMGNGDETSGDGWKFRGRGLIQLTGADNYRACGRALNINLIDEPDLIVSNPEISVQVACWFWKSRNLNELADKDDLNSITRKINGGLNGIELRKKLLLIAKNTLCL